jgi:hypothetical protein
LPFSRPLARATVRPRTSRRASSTEAPPLQPRTPGWEPLDHRAR